MDNRVWDDNKYGFKGLTISKKKFCYIKGNFVIKPQKDC